MDSANLPLSDPMPMLVETSVVSESDNEVSVSDLSDPKPAETPVISEIENAYDETKAASANLPHCPRSKPAKKSVCDSKSAFGSAEENGFSCMVCFKIMVEPVNLVCGHTFCRNCALKVERMVMKCHFCSESCSEIPPIDEELKEIIKRMA